MVRQEPTSIFLPCPFCSGEEAETVPQATEKDWVVLEGVNEEQAMGKEVVEEEVDRLPFPELQVLCVEDTAVGEVTLVL